MKFKPIYIQSLKLSNVRTFGDSVELLLEKPDGKLPNWTLILGDNGIGKSTLLHCIAWMKPNVPDPDDKTGQEIDIDKIEMNITNEENETLESLVRRGDDSTGKSTIEAVFVANRKLGIKNTSNTQCSCETGLNIGVNEYGKLNDFSASFETKDEDMFYEQEIIIYAYSASRKLGELNISNPNMEDTIQNFIADETELYDADEILHQVNYAMHGSNKREKKKYRDYLESIKKMLVGILPDYENIEDIHIEAPVLVEKRLQKKEVSISTKHGNKIPLSHFSLGYKMVTAWTIDLSWRLFNEYSKSNKPLTGPAIVLIDEIDLHLHPIWQREIMDNLSSHFPHVQFIATAHSPLMVQAAYNSNYAVLKYDLNKEAVMIENNPEGIDGWRVDQILTSEFFGLPTSRGLEYEELLKKHKELIEKENPTNKEKKYLKTIKKQLSELPAGENPEEIEDRRLISDIISKIKQKKIQIKL